MSQERRHARILAMQALCQWEVQQDESAAALEGFLLELAEEKGGAAYAMELTRAFWAQRVEVDRLISEAAERWALARISTVDRNVMRIAVVEMLDRVVPRKVAIDEAIEIGKEYGGEESPKFINGVLDKVLNSLPAAD